MTKEEIKASIAANIAGQFNQIDISGKLAGILEAIVDSVPEEAKVLDANDFENRKIELTVQEFREYLKNVHYIKLENATETQGFLSEKTPLQSFETVRGLIAGIVDTGTIFKVYVSEEYIIEDEDVQYGDYIALVEERNGKFFLIYVYFEL